MTEEHDKSTVFVTRKRWDRLFVSAALVTPLPFVLAAMAFGDPHLAMLSIGAPLGVVPLWLAMRCLTPKSGYRTSTITGTPGAWQMLGWLALVFAVLGAFEFVDTQVLGHRFNAPQEPYHFVAYGLIFVMMVGGCCWIGARYPRNSESV